MTVFATRRDLERWIDDRIGPDNVAADDASRIADAILAMPDTPRWGDDWQPWLDQTIGDRPLYGLIKEPRPEAMPLADVTIRLDAAYDLRAAGLPTDEADDLLRAYRAAAAAICDGYAEVEVEPVAGDAGCDAAWASEYGLWQAAHDCCERIDGRWQVRDAAVQRMRQALAVWMSRHVREAAARYDD